MRRIDREPPARARAARRPLFRPSARRVVCAVLLRGAVVVVVVVVAAAAAATATFDFDFVLVISAGMICVSCIMCAGVVVVDVVVAAEVAIDV